MEDWFKPNGLPSINKEFTYLLTYLLDCLKKTIEENRNVNVICGKNNNNNKNVHTYR